MRFSHGDWISLRGEGHPVKLYGNDQGHLTDRTSDALLADRQGWFNGIAARDLDGDGDIDYVVTNLGLNTKYHATPEKPTYVYYTDVDGTGDMHLLEAEYEDDTLYPVRGRSCSSNAIPSLRNKFPTYQDFAVASLQEIYTESCLDSAHRVEANTLESTVLMNDGTGKFEFIPLPRLVQAAPSFGIVLTEVNGDGFPDLYVVQNFYGPQRETGRMDGGVSLLLQGNGDGSFVPVWPNVSGLVVPGDAKALTVTDLNQDGWPDFVVSVNDDKLMAFEHRGSTENRIFNVHLQGTRGNLEAVGSRVTIHLDNDSHQTAEVAAGSGYLSQSSRLLTFGLGTSQIVTRIEIRWPDGNTSFMTPSPEQRTLVLSQPLGTASIGPRDPNHITP